MPETFFTQPVPENLLILYGHAIDEPVIQVKSDGRIFWKGREVKADEEFVQVVRIIVERLFGGPK